MFPAVCGPLIARRFGLGGAMKPFLHFLHSLMNLFARGGKPFINVTIIKINFG
jgi:hypothetical protein